MRYLVKTAYDGSDFQGWQTQPKGRTVQSEIEKTIQIVSKQKLPIVAAGRTDSGVHALGQYFHFDFETNMLPNHIKSALQTNLPDDIQIISVQPVAADFHARFLAFERRYKYVINHAITPFNRRFSVFFPKDFINLNLMKECTFLFLGSHDFSSFAKHNPDIKSTICNVTLFDIFYQDEFLVLRIHADRFLHNMVRRIVGTMMNISRKSHSPAVINRIFAKDPHYSNLIYTAEAKGLYLMDVCYPK
jgi:tRNA pseudouridine38-40 synthase